MKTDGHIIIENKKYLISARYKGDRIVFTRRDSGKDGIRFTSEEEIISKSLIALERLNQGKELII